MGLHGSLEGRAPIAHLAAQATDDALKTLLTAYMEQTRESRSGRTFGGLVKNSMKNWLKIHKKSPSLK